MLCGSFCADRFHVFAALGIKDGKMKNPTLFVSPIVRYICSLRIVKQQGVNVFNKKNLSSIAEKNIHDVGLSDAGNFSFLL